MASNIFKEKDYQVIINRINGLTEKNPRKWGTMTIDLMLEHCAIQLKIGLGVIEQSKFEGSFIMRTGFGRWFLLYVIPWPKGLTTPVKMNTIEQGVSADAFELELQSLLKLLKQVQDNPNLLPHPFFGALNKKDWGRLIWKHLNHHLKQFGA